MGQLANVTRNLRRQKKKLYISLRESYCAWKKYFGQLREMLQVKLKNICVEDYQIIRVHGI